MDCLRFLMFYLLKVSMVTGTLYAGLFHGDFYKDHIAIVHGFRTYPQGRPNKLCSYTGKIVLHPTNRCRFLRCQYARSTDPGLYAVEHECGLGYEVPEDLYRVKLSKGFLFNGIAPRDEYLQHPCKNTTQLNCPKDTPIYESKSYNQGLGGKKTKENDVEKYNSKS